MALRVIEILGLLLAVALGLTYSLEVGYSISPRGRAYLRMRAEP